MAPSHIMKSIFGSSMLAALLIVLTSGTPADPNIKYWDANAKLTWADYKDTVITGSKRVALTAAGIRMSYKTSDNDLVVLAQSQMDKSRSWVDSTKKSDYILSHEQYHFNISEYWCRKLKKDLAASHLTMKNYKEKISDMQKQSTADCKEMQTLYDAETKHSINKDEQKKWEEKVDELLKKTEAFADKSIGLTLK